MLTCRTLKAALTAYTIFAVAGCTALTPFQFKANENSGKPAGEVKLLIPPANAIAGANAIDNALNATLQGACSTNESFVLATLLPVVGELVFGMIAEHSERKLDELKEALEGKYAARKTLSVGDLKEIADKRQCLVIMRTTSVKPNDSAGMTGQPLFYAVLKLSNPGGANNPAITMQPVYVYAKSSVALTKEFSAISVGLAMSIKAVGRQQNGLPTLGLVGESSSSAPKVELGGAAACVSKPCAVSEPIPLPAGDNTMLVLGVGVSELGTLGFDVDVAKAQLGAIKAAIGPVVNDLLKAKLTD